MNRLLTKKQIIYTKELIYKYILAILSLTSFICLIGIIVILFKNGIPTFKFIGFFDLFLGKFWYPTYNPPDFGILPLILGSIWVTFGALLVCIPLGVGGAIYIYEIAPIWQKKILKPTIELLGSIPSVVYGLFGMIIIAPLLQNIFKNIPTGLCALSASLILGIMAIPTVCSISEDAFSSVPKNMIEASFALGANRWQTLIKIILPAAGSGISTAIILGINRAIGETMTVLMVAGGATIIPTSFLQPVRTMTATIAAEMGEAVYGSEHYHVLFTIGLVLFAFTFIFNIIAEIITKKYKIKLGQGI
ncbi:MAG: phosphate ABC transporter permease subunit PstC [Elusimicrobiota bacterium]|jgi:phosphate transport system permease protein|nr:phosphate ABC transporter permease subunit PstC [Elusimicrobiota bacterium]